MKKEKRFILSLTRAAGAVFFILTAALSTAGTVDAMTVWTDHATVKIRPKTPPKTGQSSANLKSAKNEFEAFQLIVTADTSALSGVDVNVSDLTDGRGNIIPAASAMIYKEAFINVSTPSTIQGGTGEWPDALIPKRDEYAGEVRNAFPFSVALGRNQPVWIEVYLPPAASAGVYSGSATVTATGQNPVVVPIQLTVWDFALPSTSSLKSAFSIDHHLLPAGHGVSGLPVALTQLYTQAGLLHRLSNSYLISPVSLGGWSAFDTTFGSFLDGTVSLPGGKLPGNRLTSVQLRDYGHKTDIPFLRDYAQHFKAKGWFDRLFQYTCDEPPNGCSWDQIKTWSSALHQADPELRSMVTTSVQNATNGGAASAIDLYVPTIRFMDNKPYGRAPGEEVPGGSGTIGNQRSKYGPEVWWYQACGSHGCGMVGGGVYDKEGYHLDWPSYMIDLPAMFSRVMEWQSWKYNIQGELYYDMVYAYGSGDAWVNQYYFGGNGDGTLFYPGKPSKIGGTKHIPIESIRLKLIREGMEDYEYMNLLKSAGDGAFADEQAARVVTNAYTWNREPLDLYDAREKMAARLLTHTTPGTPVPGPAPAPAPIPISTPVPTSDPGPTPDPEPAPLPGNTPPTAVIKASVSESDPWLLNFDAGGSHDAEGPISAVTWDFDDGMTGSDAVVSRRYDQPGTYQVTLTVADSSGISRSTSLVMAVTGVAGAPLAQWGAESISVDSTSLLYSFDAG
ncbi:MAG TPA: PKD domain-containing protein, partial [Candidatus Manganitrophaceae bacterium]|nr:PKD domain-containing protein [Candidatus Manganitrophaceae bacterium]